MTFESFTDTGAATTGLSVTSTVAPFGSQRMISFASTSALTKLTR